jgi:predicted O-linked N-acetylglucosamine transferase (SPINDLY family)
LLRAAGLDDWVMDDEASYIAAAIHLAHAPDAIAGLRAGMRDRLRRSPVCDCAALCRALEALYEADA